MAFNWLKKWMLGNADKKIAGSIVPGEAKSIGVLLDNADEIQLASIRSYFQQKGVSVDQMEFLLFLPEKPLEVPSCLYYHQKEIKWAGFAFNENIVSFLAHTYGRLYYLCADFEVHQQLILKHCKAAFKTGIYTKGLEPWLDLTIDDHPVDSLAKIKLIDNWIDKISSHGK